MAEIDLTYKKFGRLRVIRKHNERSKNNLIQWVCTCECNPNVEIIKIGKYLLNGDTKSCGCIKREMLIQRNKTVLKQKNRKFNKFNINGDYGILYIDNEEYLFDIEDYDEIKHYRWVVDKDGYARTLSKPFEKSGCFLHRLIMNADFKKITIDHINRDKKDNRKINLRLATHQENTRNREISSRNKSGIVGVCWIKGNNKWRVTLNLDNMSNNYYGEYNNFEDAVKSRLQAEKDYYGEFAPQIHLFEKYNI